MAIGTLGRSCRRAVDLLFPPACPVCDRLVVVGENGSGPTSGLVCEACRASFGYRRPQVCPRCAAPLPKSGAGLACRECSRRKLPFQAALALGEYHGALREVVLRTKKANFESLTLQMGDVLAQQLIRAQWRGTCDLVLPIPSHWWRRWSRGTSGPELLASVVARQLEIPLAPRLLRCRRQTRKQGTLLPEERLVNVRDAFVVADEARVAGRRVLLVDDVMTTGATLREAARALLKARARAVRVAVLARGTGESSPVSS